MNLPEALSGISASSSVQDLPLVGIRGLRIYINGPINENQGLRMRRDLKTFRDRFCNVLKLSLTDPNEAMAANVSVYKGIFDLYEEPQRRQLSQQISVLGELIDRILANENVDKEQLSGYFGQLSELSNKATMSGHNPSLEDFFFGRDAFGVVRIVN